MLNHSPIRGGTGASPGCWTLTPPRHTPWCRPRFLAWARADPRRKGRRCRRRAASWAGGQSTPTPCPTPWGRTWDPGRCTWGAWSRWGRRPRAAWWTRNLEQYINLISQWYSLSILLQNYIVCVTTLRSA